MAKTELGKAYVQIVPSTEGIGGSISSILNGEASSAGASAGKILSGSLSGSLTSGLGAALSLTGTAIVGAAGAAVGAATAAGAAYLSAASAASEYGDNIDKMSQKIGISAEAYQEWSYVFERNGTNIDNMQTGMKTLSSVIADAGNGSESAAEKLKAIGLSLEDVGGLSTEDQFAAVLSALQEMPAGAERTAAAVDLFGRSATDMAAVLNMSAEDTQALIDETHEYGMIMSDEMVAASAGYQDSLTKLSTTFEGLKNSIVGDALPSMTIFVDGLSDLLNGSEGAGDKIAEGIGGIADSISGAFEKIIDIAGPALETIISKLTGDFIPKLLSTAQSLFGQIIKAAPGLLQSLVSLVPSVVNALLSLVQMVAENLDDIILPIARELPGVLRSLITSLTTAAPDIISALTEALSAIFSELPDILMDMMDAVGDNLYTITGTIEKVLTTIIGMVAELLPVLVPKLMEAFTKYIDLFAQGLAASSTMFGTVIEALVKGIIEAVPAIAKAAAPLMMALSDAIIENLPIILLNMPMLILGIADGIISAIKETDWGKVWQGIVDAFKEFFGIHSPSTVFAELGDLLIQGLGGGFNDALSWIKEQIDSFVTLLIDNFKETLGLIGGGLGFLYDLGGQLVSGLVDGLKNNFANINVGEIAGGLKDQFKDLWDIHSPSGVFRDEIGKYLALGIGEGIEENVPVDSVSSAVSRLTSAASAGLGGINSAITSGIGGVGNLAMAGAGGMGDIIIPVYIGQERIDEVIVTATNRANYMSGGRV